MAWYFNPFTGRFDYFSEYALTDDLTSSEITQLQNINLVTISNAQWGYLGDLGSAPIEADGSVELTANWDAGSYKITAETFESDVFTGTAPFTVASTTVVSNLNADQVDGKDETDFLLVDGTRDLSGDWTISSNNITLSGGTLTANKLVQTNGSQGWEFSVTNDLGADVPTINITTDSGSFIIKASQSACGFYFLNSDISNYAILGLDGDGKSSMGGLSTFKILPHLFGGGTTHHPEFSVVSNTLHLDFVGGNTPVIESASGTISFNDDHLQTTGNLTDGANSLTIANAKTAYDHSQIAGGDSVHVSTTENTNWDTAYSHVSSDGTDHSYIDQDVTSGSSPTLDGTNITGVSYGTGLTGEPITVISPGDSIQTALDDGGLIYLEPGTHGGGDSFPLDVDQSKHVHLFGDGDESVIDCGDAICFNIDSCDWGSKFEAFKVDCTGYTGNRDVIDVNESSDNRVIFDRVTLDQGATDDNIPKGFVLYSDNCIVQNCYCIGIAFGVDIRGGNNNLVTGCRFYGDSTGDGVRLVGGNYNTISNNVAVSKDVGFYSYGDGASYNIFNSNVAHTCNRGIKIDDNQTNSSNFVITNNVCYNNTHASYGEGIILEGSDDCVVTGNHCVGNRYGIRIDANSARTTVRGNHCYNNSVANYSDSGSDTNAYDADFQIVTDTSPQLGGDLDLNGHNIDFPSTANISDCKDEDDMASDSATMLATQQSIKAYADSKVSDTAYGASWDGVTTIAPSKNAVYDKIEAINYPCAFKVDMNGSDQTIADNSYILVAFDTEQFDIGGGWDTTNYRFNPPVNGIYHFTFNVNWDSQGWSKGKRAFAYIYLKNSGGSAIDTALAGVNEVQEDDQDNYMWHHISTTFYLSADDGEYVEFRVRHNEGNNQTLDGTYTNASGHLVCACTVT